MAEADWTYLNDGLDIATVDRGVTAGIARPPGGGSFLYAFNSLSAVEGAVGLFANLASFAPMAKGGSIRGVVQRGPGGGPTGFSPFLFLCCQGNSVNDSAYLLGLSDDDPHRIVLRKGAVTVGLPTADEVQRRLSFPLGGPTETPGVIVMCLDGTGLDPRWSRVVTVFNATDHPTHQSVPALAGQPLTPHPALTDTADPLLRTASATTTDDAATLTVPAHSVAVFVSPLP